MVTAFQQRTLQRWAKDQTYCLGADASQVGLRSDVKTLDKLTYSSVDNAVNALNSGLISCSGFCIVWSARSQAHYLLWASEKTAADVAELTKMVQNGSVINKTVTTGLGQTPTAPQSLPSRTAISSVPPRDVCAKAVSPVAWDPAFETTSTSRLQPMTTQTVQSAMTTSPISTVLKSSVRTVTTGEATTCTTIQLPSGATAVQGAAQSQSPTQKVEAGPPRYASLLKLPASNMRPVSTQEAAQTRTKAVPQTLAEAAPSTQLEATSQQTSTDSPQMVGIGMPDVKKMAVEDMVMANLVFDPFNPQTRSLLLSKLGLGDDTVVETSEDNSGNFNDGVWILRSKTSHGLIVKLVNHIHPTRATDSEKFAKICGECPNIVGEFSFAFPVRILYLRGPDGQRCKDLIVMRRAVGLQLTQILYHKWQAKELEELLHMFKEFGTFLRTIHRVYKGRQHGDCQPSNVFYDGFNGVFTLVDCADFGFGPFVAAGGENDVEHFVCGLKSLSQWYGCEFIDGAEKHFRQGYQQVS